MIEYACPYCSNLLHIDDQFAGKSGKCKKCGNEITVPASQNEDPAPVDAEQTHQAERPRNRSVPAAIIAVALVLLAGAIAMYYLNQNNSSPSDDAESVAVANPSETDAADESATSGDSTDESESEPESATYNQQTLMSGVDFRISRQGDVVSYEYLRPGLPSRMRVFTLHHIPELTATGLNIVRVVSETLKGRSGEVVLPLSPSSEEYLFEKPYSDSSEFSGSVGVYRIVLDSAKSESDEKELPPPPPPDQNMYQIEVITAVFPSYSSNEVIETMSNLLIDSIPSTFNKTAPANRAPGVRRNAFGASGHIGPVDINP